MAKIRYAHTQTGYTILVSLGAAFALVFVPIFFLGPQWYLIVLCVIFGVALLSFGSLTITITDTKLMLRFGMGLVRKSFLLKNIAKAESVTNRWYYGWGVHLTPYGWLYNVSGWKAVQITMHGGRLCRIGTDEPEKLQKNIEEALSLLA